MLNKIRMMMPRDSNVDVVYCRDVHNAEQDQNDDARDSNVDVVYCRDVHSAEQDQNDDAYRWQCGRCLLQRCSQC